MSDQIHLNDIADELLIFNKYTIERLFKSKKPADSIALYVFYYKTAKWQKTNQIQAKDVYVKKSLSWGDDRLKNAKTILKDLGLINIIQRREDGKIKGWYIEINYMVSKKATSKIKVQTNNPQNTVLDSNNPQNQEVGKARSRKQETNALKEKDKMLEDNKIDLIEDPQPENQDQEKPHGQNQIGANDKKHSPKPENKDEAKKPHGCFDHEASTKILHRKIDLSLVPENIDQDLVIELIDYKIKKVKTFEQPSFDRTIKKIIKVSNKLGVKPNWVIEETIDAGWQGIGESDWYLKRLPKNDNHDQSISETKYKTSGVNF